MRVGVTPLEQAIASGLIDEATGFRALAQHLRLPFTAEALPIADTAIWPDAETNGIAPLGRNRHDWRFALAPRGPALRRLIARDGAPPDSGLVVTSPSRLARGFADSFPARIGRIAADSLPDASPRESCRDGPGAAFVAVLLGLSFAAAFLLTLDARGALTGATILLGFFFFINVAMRLAAIGLHRGERDATAASDAALPVYTVLAPLYREAASAPRLVAALRALDYPAAKLDIKFLLEADDVLTRDALEACDLAPSMTILIAPDGAPRTKPRALNLGLATARGDLIAIFDAEDRPDPGQLRAAAAAFEASPKIACLQARLAIENARETWITKLFALEYATLFGLIIPSLAAQHLPIALGGTSNHFRAAALREIGGWDAWNVTEDADLGLRLFRRGFRVGALDSTTWEEAPLSLKAWMDQRTRWLKGWMQTSAVHLQAPRRSIRDLGWFAFLCSIATSLGVVLSALFGPALALIAIENVAAGAPRASDGWLALAIWSFALTLLGAGLVSAIVPPLVAAQRCDLAALTPWIPLLPFYYLLVSVAAWRALAELAMRPHHWRKTEHGLSKALTGAGGAASVARA